MLCSVIKSTTRDFTFVYLRNDLDFEDLPEQLRSLFGEPEVIMELDLSARDRLGQENILIVRENLAREGYHLQLPPTEDPSGWLELTKKRNLDDD